jgi:hypothetical protein
LGTRIDKIDLFTLLRIFASFGEQGAPHGICDPTVERLATSHREMKANTTSEYLNSQGSVTGSKRKAAKVAAPRRVSREIVLMLVYSLDCFNFDFSVSMYEYVATHPFSSAAYHTALVR